MRKFLILDEDNLAKVKKIVAQGELEDGKNTAKGGAKDKKNNSQLTGKQTDINRLLAQITKVMMNHDAVKAYAHPKAIVGSRVNVYDVGQYYGWHVDMAEMQGHRTDMSFTLFLEDPESYEGGELHLKDQLTQQTIKVKGKPGEVFLYSTGLLHQVTEVTKGRRTCIIGWISSLVPKEDDRLTLLRFAVLANKLKEKLSVAEMDEIAYAQQALIRLASNG